MRIILAKENLIDAIAKLSNAGVLDDLHEGAMRNRTLGSDSEERTDVLDTEYEPVDVTTVHMWEHQFERKVTTNIIVEEDFNSRLSEDDRKAIASKLVTIEHVEVFFEKRKVENQLIWSVLILDHVKITKIRSVKSEHHRKNAYSMPFNGGNDSLHVQFVAAVTLQS